jgi:predicted transport protein
MNLYQFNTTKLSALKEISFKLEREIQTLFEQNLSLLSGFEFVKSEFSIKNYRIDTLAFDEESKSFIIIEYKRDRNYSVIDQGVSYLNLMLEYKAEFIVEYNESKKQSLKRTDVDWSQSKVIFVAPSFTDFQKQSSNFKDLAIELWEVKQFENNVLVVNPIKKSKSAPSIKQIQTSEDSEITKVSREIKVYDEDGHFALYPPEIRELYEDYKLAILNLSNDIEIVPKKLYIAFKKNKNIVDIVTLKGGLKLFINLKKGQLDDPKKITKDVSETGHWGNGDYELIVSDTTNLEYIMSLIKQVI